MNRVYLIIFVLMISGCTPEVMKCFLKFDTYQNHYTFKYSKEELKNRIVDSYSYNENLFVKNFGKTLIENKNINKQYRTSIDNWLDKENWDKHKTQIRHETSDTLNLMIGKHHSRKTISFKVIISGNEETSKLKIIDIKYQKRKVCEKNIELYKNIIQKKIEDKFINRIK